MKNFQVHDRPASALLLSFFLMTVLILVAISVSILVMKDVVTVRTIVGGNRAYYAGEGATELGLLQLKNNLPGFEPQYSGLTFLDAATADLSSIARAGSESMMVPCEDQGEEWHALALNESVQIPLFAQTDEAGTIEPIKGDHMNFYVEFYAADEDDVLNPTSIPSRDVLRWKVLGRTGEIAAPGVTEAMSEYIPLYTEDSGSDGFYTATTPTRFGTADLGGLPSGYQDGKFYSSSGASFDAGYPIATFLDTHVYNYLVLTNIITETTANDTIYYRFHADNYAPVCEYVNLEATGESVYGSAQQNLSTLVKEGENLPVFDFVIYHTDITDDEATTEDSGSFSGLDVPFSFSELFGG